MKKRTKIILPICLALVLLLGIGNYVYLLDYYHTDETALAVMANQADDRGYRGLFRPVKYD